MVQRFARDPDGIAELAAFCCKHQVGFVAMEATGEYERLPFGLFWATGVPAVIVNLHAVRRFAEAIRILKGRPHRHRRHRLVCRSQARWPPPIAATAASATATLYARLRAGIRTIRFVVADMVRGYDRDLPTPTTA